MVVKILLLSALVLSAFAQLITPQIVGCKAGEADARLRIAQEGLYAVVPAGVVGLEIQMSSVPYDMDLVVYTARDAPVVVPCRYLRCQGLGTQCPAVAKWGNTEVAYSGFGGINGQPGVEIIRFTGVLPEGIKIGFKPNFPNPYNVGVPVALKFIWQGAVGCNVPPAGNNKQGLDLMFTQNSLNHQTNRYRGVPDNILIVRRGFPFQLLANIAGATPSNTKATVAELDQWIKFTYLQSGPSVGITGTITADCPIGQYKLVVGAAGKSAEIQLVVLFNPWSDKDDTFLPDTNERLEFVENEEGFIWQGSNSNFVPSYFLYDNKEWIVLSSALRLLRRMPIPERSSAVLVSRHLSYAVNEDICYGKWSTEPPYTQGQPEGGYKCFQTAKHQCREPTNWRKISELIQVHIDVGYQRVQYCQCFVFAAVTTGVGRALGIPTRPVSNFQSAHDKNGNRAVDRFYKKAGNGLQPIEGPIEESVWNFHVWNEMWMKRNDINPSVCSKMKLAAGCADGWQAVDATPQEMSEGGSGVPNGEGEYMMGPAPVRVVRENKHEVCRIDFLNRESHPKVGCYDTNFVIAEVNANINVWIQNGGDWKQQCYNNQPGPQCGYPTDPFQAQATAGQFISTKAVGPISDRCKQTGDCSADRHDRTLAYKNAEPSWSTTSRGRKMWMQAGDGKATIKVGIIPHDIPKLINELGSIWSSVGIVAQVAAQAGSSLECHYTVTAHDYTDAYVLKTLAASTVHTGSQVVKVTSGTGQCLFTVTRNEYSHFASARAEVSATATHLKFHMSVVVISPDGTKNEYLEERQVEICTPEDPKEVLSGKEIQCRGNRGKWKAPSTKKCPDNNPLIGNGICDVALNNEQNCFDNGDCCIVSCIARNYGVDGIVPKCPKSDSQCKDPAFQVGFNERTPAKAAKIDNGADITCRGVSLAIKNGLAKAGCADPKDGKCTPACEKELNKLVCENRWMNWNCKELDALVSTIKCEWPRCQQGKKDHIGGWVWALPPDQQKFSKMLSPAEWNALRNSQSQSNPATTTLHYSWLAGPIGLVVGVVIGAIGSRRRRIAQVEMAVL
eukprot:NODE_165_length_3385_cov_86.489270_g143_i0.p1 GENE.NODE_165_length_3385_cov_86.489270_g143_i0~~NODE_165_length_3385_cov_86.489270_g143_i0.p1  ORF type:complete len:1080 (-),score=246.72 NODE_165_length_3385_cov_86.489270_g143_i0:146-3349(-)